MAVSANTWDLRGKVFLWRYRENARNYPGWHCTADRAGSLSLIEFLGALQEASTAVWRTIPLSMPTREIRAVPNNQGGAARWWSPIRWSIAYDPNPELADTWTFPPDVDPAVLSIGTNAIPELTGGVTNLMNGLGDYSIRQQNGKPETSTQLWFWWQVGSAARSNK